VLKAIRPHPRYMCAAIESMRADWINIQLRPESVAKWRRLMNSQVFKHEMRDVRKSLPYNRWEYICMHRGVWEIAGRKLKHRIQRLKRFVAATGRSRLIQPGAGVQQAMLNLPSTKQLCGNRSSFRLRVKARANEQALSSSWKLR